MKSYISTSEQDTKKIAAKLAINSAVPKFISLYGDLGAGKTIFVKGFAKGLGLKETDIKSPTYTFVREHKIGKKYLYHFDFYRIEEIDDLMQNDLLEIFERKNAFILVEWPDRISHLMPSNSTNIKMEYINNNSRKIIIKNE